LNIRVAIFCTPFIAGALVAFAFTFTATGEFTAIVVARGIALLAGLRNIHAGRFGPSRG
jgi:hypothetical protein